MALLTGPLPLVPPASAACASQQDKGPSVVALGGGHGLSASLSALRLLTSELTAIVTVADDGGSSGRLREEYGVLPPGDLRMALSALCDDTDWGRTWRDVMQHRFAPGKGRGGSLDEHAMGNLLIVTLWELLGDTVAGLKWAGALLGARGEVLPMSSVPLTIEGQVRVTAPDGDHGTADPHRPGQVRGGRLAGARPAAARGRSGLHRGADRDRAGRLGDPRAGLLVHVRAAAPVAARDARGPRATRRPAAA